MIAVVGLGAVGQTLLELLAAGSGPGPVIGVGQDPQVLERLRARLGEAVTLTDDLTQLSPAEIVVESLEDGIDAAIDLLRRLDRICAPTATFVTTTASVGPAALAVGSGRPAHTLALRLLRPPVPGAMVEPIGTTMTAASSTQAVEELIARLGLTSGRLEDTAAEQAVGLVHGYLNRAVDLLDQGWATRDDIDTAMRLGCGQPVGPLELADRIGLDTLRDDLNARHRQTGEELFRPAPRLERLVAEGRTGRKSGAGFYDYDAQGARFAVVADRSDPSAAEPIRRIAVIGSGTMAQGIAEVTARAGYPTVLVARGPESADRALAGIDGSLARAARKGRITHEQRSATLGLIDARRQLAAVADCDLVIEAVVEDLAVKQSVFAALGDVAAPNAILATTTSSLSVSACTQLARRPGRIVGLHFFNPAPAMKLVELVRVPDSTDETVTVAKAICARLGKTSVDCSDRVGFIVNYLLFPYLGQALDLLGRPDGRIEGIDAAIAQGFGFPMGPFALLDAIGLDVSLAIQQQLDKEFDGAEYAPSPILEQLVASGWLGRKNGRGLNSRR